MSILYDTIKERRNLLLQYLQSPMQKIAQTCAEVWTKHDALDTLLRQAIKNDLHDIKCDLLYVLDNKGIQISSNVTTDAAHFDGYGRDLALRPYLEKGAPQSKMVLSEVYLSQQSHRSCVTALHTVCQDGVLLGYIAADFQLHNLPQVSQPLLQEHTWRQLKGDPAIRGTLFMQKRVPRAIDEYIDDVIDIVNELVTESGVFHVNLRFSSSRATLWLVDRPFDYNVHVLDEILNPAVCLAYPERPYPENAVIPKEMVRNILERFKMLRSADDTVYLRTGTLNIMNGMVEVTFSCDGCQQMPAAEFLNKDELFWFGNGSIDKSA